MAEDNLRNFNPGDPLPGSAGFWNKVIELAREQPDSPHSQRQRIKNNPALLKVQSADGSDIAQWQPCVLGEPVIADAPYILENGWTPLMKVTPAYLVTGIQRRNLGRIVVPMAPMTGTDIAWAVCAGFVPGTVQMPTGRPITRRLTANPTAGGAGWLGLDPSSTGYQIPAGGELMWWDASVAAGGGIAKKIEKNTREGQLRLT